MNRMVIARGVVTVPDVMMKEEEKTTKRERKKKEKKYSMRELGCPITSSAIVLCTVVPVHATRFAVEGISGVRVCQ